MIVYNIIHCGCSFDVIYAVLLWCSKLAVLRFYGPLSVCVFMRKNTMLS